MSEKLSHRAEEPNKVEVYQDDIDWIDVCRSVWKERQTILVFTFIFGISAILVAFNLTEIYRAEAVLAPIDDSRSGGPFSGQIGAAATLVGLDLPADNSRVSNAIATLKSREFARNFILAHDLLIPLTASIWSHEEQRNVINPAIYDLESRSWITSKPSEGDAYREFSRILSISEDRQSSLIRVAIEWSDPVEATNWVNWLVEDINKHVKSRDLQEATSAIEFLRGQLATTQLVEMQRVFYQLIESQTRIVMLAGVRNEYIFQVIDPAVVPEEPVRPRRALIVLMGIVIGMFASLAILLIRYFFRAIQD